MHGNIWYVSDYGSDDNDCHSASAPCRNLQTVLDRAIDGADIYITSNTLSLDFMIKNKSSIPNVSKFYDFEYCVVQSNLCYSLRSYNGSLITLTCSGLYRILF